ncbi:MAG: DUF559 domain-containing protein, partial [Solirubrobacteraceae bacterium]
MCGHILGIADDPAPSTNRRDQYHRTLLPDRSRLASGVLERPLDALADLLADDTTMAISRSRAEKALLKLIRDARLPMPDTNVKFGRFEADFVWREQKLIVELDSATYHSGPGVFHRDHEKDLVFRGAGY